MERLWPWTAMASHFSMHYLTVNDMARLCSMLSISSYFDGQDVSQYPLVGRKAALQAHLREASTGRIRYTEHIEEQGERLFTQLEAIQLKGMVCKRKDSVYAFARSKHWLKVKTCRC
jgi:ATP-dependent DNA ligase